MKHRIDIKKIIRGLPKNFEQNAVRDVSLLSSEIFCDMHGTAIPRIFGSRFTAVMMMSQGAQVGAFRSPTEYGRFSENLARRYLRAPAYAKHVAKMLKKETDWIERFMKKHPNRKSFIKDKDIFFGMYKEWFAYHQATQWGGNAMTNIVKNQRKVLKTQKLLQQAYKYNELLSPHLEKYFRKLGIGQLLTEELDILGIKVPKNRSVMYFKGSRLILTPTQAKQIAKAVMKPVKGSGSNEVSGIAATKGRYRGRVRVIRDLQKLGTLKKGEVLITTMTRPQYNNVVRYAGAIVTDEGSVLDHAAILAREYGIPTIVGTKNATKSFKTGDSVEVNAERGIVRKLGKR